MNEQSNIKTKIKINKGKEKEKTWVQLKARRNNSC